MTADAEEDRVRSNPADGPCDEDQAPVIRLSIGPGSICKQGLHFAAMTSLEDLRRSATLAREHHSERDRLIRGLREAGHSWGELAEASCLTRAAVKKIAERSPRLTGTVVSVGYEGRTLDEFLDRLTTFGVTAVADVRLTPLSRKRGFSKKALNEALQHRDIAYLHLRGLGNPKDNREAFRSGSAASRKRYVAVAEESGAQDLNELTALIRDHRVALLCFELDHLSCHRSCVTEILQRHHPGLSVVSA